VYISSCKNGLLIHALSSFDMIGCIILLQGDCVGGLAFLGADEVSVDLGGADVLVGQHLGDVVDVGAE